MKVRSLPCQPELNNELVLCMSWPCFELLLVPDLLTCKLPRPLQASTAAAALAAAAVVLLLSSEGSSAATFNDTDILNFALNLEVSVRPISRNAARLYSPLSCK